MRCWLVSLLVVMATAGVGVEIGEAGCAALETGHLPAVVRSLELGVTTPEAVRERFGSEGVEISEKWDTDLGGADNMVVDGLASMTPNNGLHFGEITVRRGAANLEEYLLLTFRFADVGEAEPVLYWIGVTTKADDEARVCDAPRALAEQLEVQKRPRTPPNLPPPRATESRATFYPCLADGRVVIVKCDDGNVTITFNGERYPISTVSYELLVAGSGSGS